MAWQLIYTSAPRTLTAGQTGYGTVARSMDLRDALIQRLEQLSYFQHGDNRAAAPPVIHAYRILDLRGAKYHVLTRLVDAGLDFTNRTNHLAHHLVFTPEELGALPSPALIFLHWPGWRNSWTNEPRFLDEGDWLGFTEMPRAVGLPAESWSRLTGDAGRAVSLVTKPAASGCQLACEPGQESEWLALFAESLQLLDPEKKSPAQRWTFPFTTHLQEQDQPNDFRWRGSASSSTGAVRAADLPVPAGELAELARRGPRKPVIAPVTPRVGVAPTVSAKPVVVRADNSTARPLRLQDKKPSTAARIDDGESEDEPRRSNSLLRAAPVVVALLVVLIALGFWKPGLFKRGGASPASSPIKETVGSQLGRDETKITNADFVRGSAETNNPPVVARKPKPSPKALAELDQRLDASMPTYLHFHNEFTTPLDLPAHPRLVSLLEKIMTGNQPVMGSMINVSAITNVLRLDALDFSMGKALKLETTTEKYLRASGKTSGTEEFKLSFAGSVTNLTFNFSESPPSSLTVVIRPSGTGSPFEPFRLMVADTRQQPVPVALSKTFLSADQTNFEATVDARLTNRLANIVLPRGAKWELRAYVTANEQLRKLTPTNGTGINLRSVREELARRITATNDLFQKSQAEVTRLTDEVHHAHTNDVELGRLLKREESALVSFGSYCAAPAHKAGKEDRAAFRAYLGEVLKVKIDGKELEKLKVEDTREEALKHFDEQLTQGGKAVPGLPPGYFNSRWGSLGSVEKLAVAKKTHGTVDKNLREATKALEQAPKNIDDLHHVSLEVVQGASRLELIRFTDASEPKTK